MQTFLKGKVLMSKIISFLLLILVSISLKSQNPSTLEMFSASFNTALKGPTTSPQSFTLLENVNNPYGNAYSTYSPEITVTYSISNQQYNTATGMPNGAGLTMGGTWLNADSIGDSTQIFKRMSIIAIPSDLNFTSSPDNITGSSTGISADTNYAVWLFSSSRVLFLDASPTNGRYYYADLSLTFSSAVDNPILHFSGLGGRGGNTNYSTELELVNTSDSLVLLSGSAYIDITDNKLSNTAEYPQSGCVSGAACGSVMVEGTDITTLTFRVYLRGAGNGSWASENTHPGDVWMLGVSLNTPTPSALPDLYVDKTVSDSTVNIGDTVTFSIATANNGAEATGVEVMDLLPSGYSYISHITTSGSYNDATGIWNIGNIPTSSIDTLFITVKINPSGSYLNTATASSNENDANLNDNASSAIVVLVGANNPPIAVGDTISINEDDSAQINILTNDYDFDGTLDSSSVDLDPSTPGQQTSFSTPEGTWSVDANGQVTFVPNENYHGPAIIYYTVLDNDADTSNLGLIVVTVNPVNDPPVLANEHMGTDEDTPLTGDITNALDYDPDSTTLNLNTTPVSGPLHGEISVSSNGTFTYLPDSNYTGLDTVIFEICDAGYPNPILCAYDTLFVTVNPINDPPVLANEIALTEEDTPVSGDVTTSEDFDPDNTSLVLNTTPISGPLNGSIIVNVSGLFTYTPNAGFNGIDTIVFEICDSGTPLPALCEYDTLFVYVGPVNDAPVLENEYYTTNEDTAVAGDVTTIADYDPDSTQLILNTTPLYGPSNGEITVNADGTFIYVPDSNFNGLDTIIFEICDEGNPPPVLCANDTLFITVNPVNDPPVLVNEFYSTTEDVIVSGDVTTSADYDPDNTVLTLNTSPISGPDNGMISINASGQFTYTPNAGFYGIDTIVFEICDAGTPLPVLCSFDTLFILVDPVNDPPVTFNDTIYVPMNTSYSPNFFQGILGNGDYDPDSTNLYIAGVIVQPPSNGTLIVNSDGSYTYVPDNNFVGADTFVVEVCDNGVPLPSECTNDTVFIFVVNDLPPVTFNEDYFIQEDDTLTQDSILGVLGNGDYDPEGSPIDVDVNVVLPPSNGTFNVNPDGSFTYIPDPNFYGNDTIVVDVCDSNNLCTTDTIVIEVEPINDPIVLDNEYHTINEDSLALGNLINNGDYDPDGTNLNVDSVLVLPPAHGTLILDENGSYLYVPDEDYYGFDTIVVQICDSGFPMPALCDNDTIFIEVLPINDVPVIVNENHLIVEDSSATGNILTNDYDPDGTSLNVDTVPVSGPNHGTFQIDPDGNYTYEPDSNFFGLDTVVVLICDSGYPLPVICVNDTIFIEVLPINDALVIDNENHVIIEDSVATGDLTDMGDYDPDSTTLWVDPIPVYGPNHGTISINSDGTYTYSPNPNFNGFDTVLVQVCDSGIPLPVTCGIDTIFIEVTPVNDPPVVDNETHTILNTDTVTGQLIDTGDYDPDTTTLTVDTIPVSGPSNGEIDVNEDGTYTYTPNAGFVGTDTIVVLVCDEGNPLPALCVNDTIFIHVSNPAVSIVNEWNTITNGDTASGSITMNDSPFGFVFDTILVNPNNGTISIQTDGSYTYVPDSSFSGYDTVITSICFEGNCENDTLFITVKPNINNELDSTEYNQTISGTIGANDVGTGLNYSTNPALNPSNGDIIINSDGTYSYTPDDGFSGFDTIIITVCDASVPPLCAYDTLVIYVSPFIDIFVPQGISPDGDNINDVLIIQGLEKYPNNQLKILNRWGNLVYKREKYNNDWGGTCEEGIKYGGDLLPAGTYFYILDLGEEDIDPLTGYIFITRP